MDTFSALATATRRNIFEILAAEGRLSVADICAKFNITPSAISQHLKILREAKLVRVAKQGQQRIYTVNPTGVRELEGWAAHISQRFDTLDDVLEGVLEMEQKAEMEQKKSRQTSLETENSIMAKHHPTTLTAQPGQQELFVVREFDAPRALVFKAHVDPDLFVQWIGPRQFTTTLTVFKAEDDGSYQYIQTDKDGNEYAFHGVFHEVLAPERIIQTFEFAGLPEKGHVALDTLTFEALPDNRTKVTMHSVFQSVADRDGMIAAGMESGVVEGNERLDELLQKLQR